MPPVDKNITSHGFIVVGELVDRGRVQRVGKKWEKENERARDHETVVVLYSIANRPASMTQVRMSTSISSTRSAEFPIHQTEKQMP